MLPLHPGPKAAERIETPIRQFGSGSILCVAISPDGGKILVGTTSRRAQLLDVATGAEIRGFSGYGRPVSSVAFSPDDSRILVGSEDHMARMYDAASGDSLRTFPGGGWSTNVSDMSAVFSFDGGQVLTRTFEGGVKLWNVATGALIRAYSGDPNRISEIALSPDGTRILVGLSDSTAQLWDAATGDTLRVLAGHRGEVTAVANLPGRKAPPDRVLRQHRQGMGCLNRGIPAHLVRA